jgi:hypothetical protein
MRRKTMINHTKIAMLAAVVAMGIVTPALAAGVRVIPQYSPGFGNTAVHQGSVRNRPLYDSAVTPNAGWAYDPAWSTTGRQNSGH